MRMCIALLLVGGCGALDEFEEVITDEVTIPAQRFGVGGLFSPDFGGLDDIQLSQARTFKNEGVDPNDVDAIFVKSLELQVSTGSPALDRLDYYLESIEFFIEAPGQTRRSLGALATVPEAASAMLPVDPTFNLKPYAVAPSMTVSAQATLKGQPRVNVTLRVILTLAVDINLGGV